MRTKKISAIFITIIFTIINLGIFPDISYAKEAVTSGEYFDVNWNYDEATKELSITGNGEIQDWLGDEGGFSCPWDGFYDKTETIIIGDGITHIGAFAFSCFEEATTVTIPDSVTSISWCAFSDCKNLKSIILPEGLEEIFSSAFAGCESLKEIVIPDRVKSIDRAIFWRCDNLSSVTLPNNLKTLPREIFYGCTELKRIKIPDSVTTIDARAFENSGITSIVIPKNVKTLKSEIFNGCEDLKTITIKSSKIKYISENAFTGVSETTVIKVPKKMLKTYKKMFYKAGLSKKVRIE